MRNLLKLLLKSQKEVLQFISKDVKKYTTEDSEVFICKDYIYVKSDKNNSATKPLLVSHLDTINDSRGLQLTFSDIDVNTNGIIRLSSISNKACLGGDDRVGVWTLLELMKSKFNSYDYLFTTDEEVGGKGVAMFIANHKPNNTCLLEIDRAGTGHIASYGYGNEELEKIFESYGYHIESGIYTDIVDIASEVHIAGYNIACGYYKQHTKKEFIVVEEVYKVLTLLLDDNFILQISDKQYTCKAKHTSYSSFLRYSFDDCEPIFCECCGSHSALYRDGAYIVCEDCLGLLTDMPS